MYREVRVWQTWNDMSQTHRDSDRDRDSDDKKNTRFGVPDSSGGCSQEQSPVSGHF